MDRRSEVSAFFRPPALNADPSEVLIPAFGAFASQCRIWMPRDYHIFQPQLIPARLTNSGVEFNKFNLPSEIGNDVIVGGSAALSGTLKDIRRTRQTGHLLAQSLDCSLESLECLNRQNGQVHALLDFLRTKQGSPPVKRRRC